MAAVYQLALLWIAVILADLLLPSTALPQTPTQENVTLIAREEAEPASMAAQGEVHRLFDPPATRRYMEEMDDGSHLYRLPTATLVNMFWNEVSVAGVKIHVFEMMTYIYYTYCGASSPHYSFRTCRLTLLFAFLEVVHSFGEGASPTANCGFDMTIAVGERSKLFYNQWQLESLGIVPIDAENNVFMEWSEVNLFNYPPFRNTSDPDLPTSTDRPLYAALNMYRGSGGNPQCGPITAILNREYLQDDIICAPVDTGYFNGGCSQGQQVGQFGSVSMGVCDAWPSPYPLGAPSYLQHLLEPYVYFFNHSETVADDNYPYWNLARLTIRLLSRLTYLHDLRQAQEEGDSREGSSSQRAGDVPLRLNFVENTLGYMEHNPTVAIALPSGIKMMVGMFEVLWGTPLGQQLRVWCGKMGWPLAWAFNPSVSRFRCGPDGDAPGCEYPENFTMGMDTASARILDPAVLAQSSAGHNITVSEEERALFEKMWSESREGVPQEGVHAAWLLLNLSFRSSLGIEPLFYKSCESPSCVGVLVESQQCVCPA